MCDNKMFYLINEISELVYVVDIDTYELLFMNKAGKDIFHIKNVKGLKCYKALYNKETPCEFCTNSFLNYNSFYNWEITNPLTKRHYLLKDKLIEWNGKKGHIQIAFDMTEKENQKKELSKALETECMITDCIKLLHITEDVSTALNNILRMIGTYLEAEYACIFKVEKGLIEDIYEWCENSENSYLEKFKSIDIEIINKWNKTCEFHKNIIINNVEKLKNFFPEEYRLLHELGIKSLIAVPLDLDEKFIGVISIENFSVEKIRNISNLLNTLSYFISYTFQKEKNRNILEQLSYFDGLTGVWNRNAFMRDIDLFSKADPVSIGVVYIDVNGMKGINDLHGHQYGDQILIKTTEEIKSIFINDNLYRVNGDEFVVISCKVNIDIFKERIKQLKQNIQQNEEYHIAIGYRWSDNSSALQQLIFEADEMRYIDKKHFYWKKAVPKRYRHDNDDILGLTKKSVLEQMVGKERFLVYFQPKISVQNRSLIGAEALVRYKTSRGTIVAPDQFIPILEEVHLISIVDFYVFDSVCAKISEWLEEGNSIVPVSVNFSRCSLVEENFSQRLEEIWRKYNIPKAYIEIEVTETIETNDNYSFLRVMEIIRNLGFAITIDDFGVRYANLSLFTTANFDVLKIDKSLITDLPENKRAQAVLQSITDICRKMGVHLIVEGVETEEQLDVLKQINCDGAQGYLFSRPLPLKEFELLYL